MDTATHIAMGVAIGGLATLDPAVQQDPVLFQAVLAGTIAGSHAPDFDTVLKLKNNATYIRNHRGITHSLPAILMWGTVISAFIFAFVPDFNYVHLFLWTLLSVAVHVFVDVFNAYGTQAARPLTKKWIALGFINTFDPYIFSLHLAGIVAWLLGANPGETFLILYFVIALYYVKRYLDKREMVQIIHEHFENVEQVVTSPTIRQNIWRIAISTKDKYYVARAEDGHIQVLDQFERKPLPKHPAVEEALKDHNIRAFISFSPIYRWEISEFDGHIEVRFIDLRYRAREHYPFVAIVHLDKHLNKINSFTGWIYSKQKMKKKLNPLPN